MKFKNSTGKKRSKAISSRHISNGSKNKLAESRFLSMKRDFSSRNEMNGEQGISNPYVKKFSSVVLNPQDRAQRSKILNFKASPDQQNFLS
jgi:hypothetical protein